MPINSKSKGSAYERVTARQLSQWLYGNTTSLYRSRASGALFTKSSFVSEVGDISPIKTSVYFPFCIECKNRETGCGIDSLLIKGDKSELYKWFSRNEADAATANLFPLLIFKQNYAPTMVLFRQLGKFATESGPSKFSLSAFRFSEEDVIYLAKLSDLIEGVKGGVLLNYLKVKGYKAHGE